MNAEEIIEKMRATYAGLQSYRGIAKVRQLQRYSDERETTYNICFTRPNLFRVDWDLGYSSQRNNPAAVWSDGRRVRMLMPGPAGRRLDVLNVSVWATAICMCTDQVGMIAMQLVLPGMAPQLEMKNLRIVGEEICQEKLCHKLELDLEPGEEHLRDNRGTLWIATDTWMLVKVVLERTIDTADFDLKIEGLSGGFSVHDELICSNVTIDQKIPDDVLFPVRKVNAIDCLDRSIMAALNAEGESAVRAAVDKTKSSTLGSCGTAALLAGILNDPHSSAARALEKFGIDFPTSVEGLLVRKAIGRNLGAGR